MRTQEGTPRWPWHLVLTTSLFPTLLLHRISHRWESRLLSEEMREIWPGLMRTCGLMSQALLCWQAVCVPWREVSGAQPAGSEDGFNYSSSACPVRKAAQDQISMWILPPRAPSTRGSNRLDAELKSITLNTVLMSFLKWDYSLDLFWTHCLPANSNCFWNKYPFKYPQSRFILYKLGWSEFTRIT